MKKLLDAGMEIIYTHPNILQEGALPMKAYRMTAKTVLTVTDTVTGYVHASGRPCAGEE